MNVVVLLGCVVLLAGGFAYVRDTFWGRTQPNRVSFILWAAAPIIASAASFSEGVTWASLPIFIAGINPLLVLAASFVNKQAYWKLGGFDWVCGALSVAGLVLWQITAQAEVAIVFAILADFTAALPTLRKSWTNPESETPALYLATTFSSLTSFAAVQDWSFTETAFPTYLATLCAVLFLLTSRNPKLQRVGR